MNATSDQDESIPPPAYTEQEFERKVSNVIQASLADDQDEWEEWDEAKFEAAALQAQSSMSSSRPSSSGKKLPPCIYPPEKLARELHSPSSHSLGQSSNARKINHPPTLELPQSHHQLLSPGDIHYGDDENTSAPPPAFTGVGPSLDGPPYEEVVRLSYNPYTREQISPRLPSPSWSSRREDIPPRPSSAATSIHSYLSEGLGSHEESHNQRNLYPSTYSRQSANYAPRVQPAIPRMDFNPAVAYERPVPSELPATTRSHAQPIDASAFYNSSISSYLSVRESQTARSMPHQTKFLPLNTYQSQLSPGHFNGNPFTTPSPASPIPTYHTVSPPANAPSSTPLPHRPNYRHVGPGLQLNSDEPRWAMSEQQFPF
ncbi:hypothetical protein E1B28_004322 [Marasmius oreades]|uniref:Uncharacterized protein n=1 Tax=Marasmius oreades TaxID=181124 RepID=A0A9P7UYG3_9AGAR|nr:uncharacterized protein E1B28_004322 [Marasmius oreades]KAG7096920.1 hypothetical protein E1B28_004322 [Marasmius oreades]